MKIGSTSPRPLLLATTTIIVALVVVIGGCITPLSLKMGSSGNGDGATAATAAAAAASASSATVARHLQGLPPGVDPNVGVFLALASTAIPFLGTYETPIAIRFTSYLDSLTWNCVASFATDYKDVLTKELPEIQVPDSIQDHVTLNRVLCVTQAWVSFLSLTLPESLDALVDVSNSIFNPQGISIESAFDSSVIGCDSGDIACLTNIASNGDYNPLLMGHIVAKQVYDYSIEDGYNPLGTDVTDDGHSCVVNCRPYSDTTGYKPVNSAYGSSTGPIKDNIKEFEKNDLTRWEPLLESNNQGFFYRQEHVTPHIGENTKFRFLPESDRTTRVAPSPTYSESRDVEAQEVIALMNALDDIAKIEIEVFDDKLRVALAVITTFLGLLPTQGYVDTVFDTSDGNGGKFNLTFERLAHFLIGFTGTELDAVIIAWKEKINYDLIRPTTVIKRLYGDITTWAPNLGTDTTYPAKDFEAYIRVMPHSEYVSGSACLFQGLEEYLSGYVSALSDGGITDTSYPVSFPPVLPGESIVEPNVSPQAPVELSYATIQDMAAAGSQSRLNGGMHFGESVPAANTLCSGIGTSAVNGVFDLIA